MGCLLPRIPLFHPLPLRPRHHPQHCLPTHLIHRLLLPPCLLFLPTIHRPRLPRYYQQQLLPLQLPLLLLSR